MNLFSKIVSVFSFALVSFFSVACTGPEEELEATEAAGSAGSAGSAVADPCSLLDCQGRVCSVVNGKAQCSAPTDPCSLADCKGQACSVSNGKAVCASATGGSGGSTPVSPCDLADCKGQACSVSNGKAVCASATGGSGGSGGSTPANPCDLVDCKGQGCSVSNGKAVCASATGGSGGSGGSGGTGGGTPDACAGVNCGDGAHCETNASGQGVCVDNGAEVTLEFSWVPPAQYPNSSGTLMAFQSVSKVMVRVHETPGFSGPQCDMMVQGGVYVCSKAYPAGLHLDCFNVHMDASWTDSGQAFAFDAGDWPGGGCFKQSASCTSPLGTVTVKRNGKPVSFSQKDNNQDNYPQTKCGYLVVNP